MKARVVANSFFINETKTGTYCYKITRGHGNVPARNLPARWLWSNAAPHLPCLVRGVGLWRRHEGCGKTQRPFIRDVSNAVTSSTFVSAR